MVNPANSGFSVKPCHVFHSCSLDTERSARFVLSIYWYDIALRQLLIIFPRHLWLNNEENTTKKNTYHHNQGLKIKTLNNIAIVIKMTGSITQPPREP